MHTMGVNIYQKVEHIHNSQHNQIFFSLFKLIQQSIYGHFELPRNQNLNLREKKVQFRLKIEICGLKTQKIADFDMT